MTIQVGMVGTDGIVLASDTKWTERRELRSSFDTSKVKIDYARGIAISYARNMETSGAVAKAILSDLKDDDWKYPQLPIEALSKKIIDDSGDRQDVQCLIVSTKPSLRLFSLRTGTQMPEAVLVPLCEEISGKAVIGDDQNTAVFWAEMYYEERPVKELVLLAAQVVISAKQLNSGAIDGLEVVLCDPAGVRRLTKQSNRELKARAEEIHRYLQSSFINHEQQFVYEPEVNQ